MPFRAEIAVQEDCLPLEDGTERLSRNVDNCLSKLRNIPEEGRSHLNHSGSLKLLIKPTHSASNRFYYCYYYYYSTALQSL